MFRIPGNTHLHIDVQRKIPQLEHRGHRLLNRIDARVQGKPVRHFHQQHKGIAADVENQPRVADRGQALRRRLDHRIAGVVAETVIDIVDTLQTEANQRKWPRILAQQFL